MKEFPISFDICLGYHCCGCGEYVDAQGSVRLEDTQVTRLVALIRECGGETDVDVLSLEEKLPDVYSALEDAYSAAAGTAVYRHWLLEGYECGYFDAPKGLMEILEAEGLFKYEPNPDDEPEMGRDETEEDVTDDEDADLMKEEAFDEWKEEYFDSLDEDAQVAFIEKYYGEGLVNEDGPDGGEYEIEIPQGIIDMVNTKDA